MHTNGSHVARCQVGGRYDKSKPLRWNVDLPPAILSRFDLVRRGLRAWWVEPDDCLLRRSLRPFLPRNCAVNMFYLVNTRHS